MIELILTADSSGPYNLTWPSWKVFGAALPTSIPASKTIIVSLKAIGGTADANVFACSVSQV
jgi:hypothetical protein